MSIPFDYTQNLLDAEMILGAATSTVYYVASDFPISGEVPFHTNFSPGFNAGLDFLATQLSLRAAFAPQQDSRSCVITFTGWGLDDMTMHSNPTDFAGTKPTVFKMVIARLANDYIDIYHNDVYYGSTFCNEVTTPVGLDLNVKFGSTTGHTVGDYWEFTYTPKSIQYLWEGKPEGSASWIDLTAEAPAYTSVAGVTTTDEHVFYPVSGLDAVPMQVRMSIYESTYSGELTLTFTKGDLFARGVGQIP